MAIKINATEVITNSRSVTNINTFNMTDNYGPNVDPIPVDINSFLNIVGIDIVKQSQYFVTLETSASIILNDSQKGSLAELILDTQGNTPTFFESQFYWSGGSQPDWSDSDLWRISLIGVSSTACVAAAVAYDAIDSVPEPPPPTPPPPTPPPPTPPPVPPPTPPPVPPPPPPGNGGGEFDPEFEPENIT